MVFDIMLFSWGSLQRVEDDGFCVCFFTQRKRLQSLCPCCLKLTTSHHHHHHHHDEEVLLFSHSLTHWTHTELNCFPVRRKKGILEGFRNYWSKLPACLLSSFTVQKTRWDKFDTVRASPVVLSMSPCKSFFHIQVLVICFFFFKPTHESETGAANRCGRLLIANQLDQFINDGPIRSTEQQSDHIYYTLFCRSTMLLRPLPATANWVILLSQTSMFWLFFIQFYCARAHAEQCWRCSKVWCIFSEWNCYS